MSLRPRIEEVEDDDEFDVDNMDMDPEQFDPKNHIITAADLPSAVATRQQSSFVPPPTQPTHRQQFPRPPQDDISGPETKYIKLDEMGSKYKAYQCLYPIYFDISRSRADGRRVGKEYAVKNPLARELIPVLNMNGFQTIFEPTKTHPRDWANPGRIRVLIKEDGKPVHPKIQNKRQLYALIGVFLQTHPITEQSPLNLRLPNLPHPDKPLPPPAVPKGWKLNDILPIHSPAVSGGGVSDNIFKDMMGVMGMGGDDAGPSTPAIKEKKEKKKGKR